MQKTGKRERRAERTNRGLEDEQNDEQDDEHEDEHCYTAGGRRVCVELARREEWEAGKGGGKNGRTLVLLDNPRHALHAVRELVLDARHVAVDLVEQSCCFLLVSTICI